MIGALEARYPAAYKHLDATSEDLLPFAAFLREIEKQIYPQERLNKEIGHRAARPARHHPPGRLRAGRADR
ncbi:transposase-like protein [Nonomuraea endophytica]|uniref:Transposase-like protein n=2 Tax=Nonomuraea endophytica TaxID=714136 RepID=A0A7W7ZXA7_9ACTN|nr:transposase-like protein [Nonomuraea endophytica]